MLEGTLPKELRVAYESLKQKASQADILHSEALIFLNREMYGNNYDLNSSPEDSYALRHNRIFPEVLNDIWFKDCENEIKFNEELIFKSLENALRLEKSEKIVAGAGTPNGDDVLYAAFQMFPDVRDNLYFIVAHSARYNDKLLWFLEGNLDDFLNADSIGRMPREEERENGVTSKVLIPIDKQISLRDFGRVYKEAIRDGTIRSES